MSAGTSVAIYGAGRTGLAVARLARERGVTVTAVWNRSSLEGARAALAQELPLAIASRPGPQAADLWLLAVADDAIPGVSAALAAALAYGEPRPRAAAHCAGARRADDLAPLRAAGIACGSWHPAMTFRGADSDAAALARAWVALEGDAAALAVLQAFTGELGLAWHAVAGDGKLWYHTALVIAANGRVALDVAAGRLLADAGLEEGIARRVLAPLVARTEENLRAAGPSGALTGPVARGDATTVRSQLEALGHRPSLRRLYRALGAVALSLVPPEACGEGHRAVAHLVGTEDEPDGC